MAVNGTPRHIAFFLCGQRANTCQHTVRRNHDTISLKQCRDFGLIGLKLIKGRGQGCVFIRWVFKFNHRNRQAIDKADHIRATVMTRFYDCELIEN